MTDEEFNRYCAEVMGYQVVEPILCSDISALYVSDGGSGCWLYSPTTAFSQMAEVFDKLFCPLYTTDTDVFIVTAVNSGIAKAMREFIEGTKQ